MSFDLFTFHRSRAPEPMRACDDPTLNLSVRFPPPPGSRSTGWFRRDLFQFFCNGFFKLGPCNIVIAQGIVVIRTGLGEQRLVERLDVYLQKVPVEVLFILKMVVDHGLGEARCFGDFAHGRAVIAFL